MSNKIEKARAGNAKEMLELYGLTKRELVYLAGLLLGDEMQAQTALPQIYKIMWEELFMGLIADEQSFYNIAIDKTVQYCRNQILKYNNKAFKIPKNQNFNIIGIDSGSMILEPELAIMVVKNLPPLHRFIYVLYGSYEYSKQELAKLFGYNEKIINLALESESANIFRILFAATEQTSISQTMSAEEFHASLRRRVGEIPILESSQQLIEKRIYKICEPIQERQKKEFIKAIGMVSIALFVLAVVSLGVVMIVGRQQGQTDSEGSEIVSESDSTTEIEDSVLESESITTESATE